MKSAVVTRLATVGVRAAALGHKRTFFTILAECPLPGVKRTLVQAEIANSNVRNRPKGVI